MGVFQVVINPANQVVFLVSFFIQLGGSLTMTDVGG